MNSFPLEDEQKKREEETTLTLTLERRTGDSRNDVGLRPGGMVIQADLEIGSLAGDMSLYLAPPLGPAAFLEKTAASEPSELASSTWSGA